MTAYPTPSSLLADGLCTPSYQSELTAAEAAGLWSQVKDQADKFDMELVSPAINFCYGECIEEASACGGRLWPRRCKLSTGARE